MELTRDKIRDRHYHRIAIEENLIPVLSEAERQASRRAVLEEVGPRDDVWIFAYGSLMWNPAIHFAERCRGMVHGYHRPLCLWSYFARGTREAPGLLLGLDRGGCCAGAVYRIAADDVEAETEILWAREMLSPVYEPRWVRVRIAAGPVRAITFVVNRACEFYAGAVSNEEIAASIATATGKFGRTADYLHAIMTSLDELGIEDKPLRAIHDLVESACAERRRPGVPG